ncbi:MAG: porin [Octadecabacter sp.]
MKSILLASTAVIALAGAAAAEVTFGGSATLGYNSDSSTGNTDGFYWDASIAVTLSQTLDNGLTAGASFDLSLFSSSLSSSVSASGLVLSLVSDNAGLYFGDTEFAAIGHWASAGDMEQDHFSEADGEIVLRGDMTFGGWDASVSYIYDQTDDDLDQLSLGVSGAFGSMNVALAYQAAENDDHGTGGDFNDDEVIGLSVGTSFSGADVTFAYVVDNTNSDSSLGVKVAYPVGPVTLTGYYVSESAGNDNWGINAAYASGPVAVTLDFQNDQGTEIWTLEGSYDVGNGLMIMAGSVDNGNDFYVAGSYDLGGGATLLVSYADDADYSEGDAIGDPEYQTGTTVELSLAF